MQTRSKYPRRKEDRVLTGDMKPLEKVEYTVESFSWTGILFIIALALVNLINLF